MMYIDQSEMTTIVDWYHQTELILSINREREISGKHEKVSDNNKIYLAINILCGIYSIKKKLPLPPHLSVYSKGINDWEVLTSGKKCCKCGEREREGEEGKEEEEVEEEEGRKVE